MMIDLADALGRRGFYCQIEGHHHPYSEQAKQRSMANLATTSIPGCRRGSTCIAIGPRRWSPGGRIGRGFEGYEPTFPISTLQGV